MTAAFIIVSLISGVLFGVMDGLINANPLAVRLYAVYKPLARSSLNLPAGILIDLIWGILLAGAFLLLYASLPGETGLIKGVSFAVLIWIFRVVMNAVGQWLTFTIPVKTLLYTAAAGLGEMLILGVLYGLTLHP